MTASARQHSRSHEQRVPHVPSELPIRNLAITNWQACGGRRSVLLSAPKSNEQVGGGGRNARATSRTCARCLECPPAIHPRESPGCRWLCRNHSASSGNFTFRWTHFPSDRCASQHKKLTPLCRSCGRCDFPVEDGGKLRINISGPDSLRQPFQ